MGIPTIGIGLNLQRSDAPLLLERAGVTDVSGIYHGTVTLTEDQIDDLFDLSFAPILGDAASSLQHFSAMSDARRFVVCDLVYNLGLAGWLGFSNTRALLDHATSLLKTDASHAHLLYGLAADHLMQSPWYGQVGDRAKRDVAMIRSSEWVEATGAG